MKDFLNNTVRLNGTFSSRVGSIDHRSEQKPKVKLNYKANMKTMIHQRYIKKIEDLQKKHEKEIHLLHKSFAVQLEDLTESLAFASMENIKTQDDAVDKIRCKFSAQPYSFIRCCDRKGYQNRRA